MLESTFRQKLILIHRAAPTELTRGGRKVLHYVGRDFRVRLVG